MESAVIQWNWLEDVFPDADQWNSVHDRLVKWWRDQKLSEAHFFNSGAETSGEEEMTVAYLRDTAAIAGLATYGHEIEDVGWDESRRAFRGLGWAAHPDRVQTLPVGGHAGRRVRPVSPRRTGDHAGAMDRAGLEDDAVHQGDPAGAVGAVPGPPEPAPGVLRPPGRPARMGRETTPWPGRQQHRHPHRCRTRGPRPRRPVRHVDDGLPAVAPTSVVRREPGGDRELGGGRGRARHDGAGVRGPITDYYARFVPHAIGTSPRPDAETVQQWLAE